MSAKEHHCPAPRLYGSKQSAQCLGPAVPFLSRRPVMQWVKKFLAGDFHPSCLTIHSCCLAAQQVCSALRCPEEMLVIAE